MLMPVAKAVSFINEKAVVVYACGSKEQVVTHGHDDILNSIKGSHMSRPFMW